MSLQSNVGLCVRRLSLYKRQEHQNMLPTKIQTVALKL
uniref:Uncharacterized protein n=1 Tax=Anguilla anguilla TaxID=7936 RepID=A0A0E9VKV5_ANGAN